MQASSWPLITAAIHQSGAVVEDASAEHVRFRTGAVSVDLYSDPSGRHPDELKAIADLGGVDESLRECCFEALLSANLHLSRGGRSSLGIDIANQGRIVFASRIPSPEVVAYANFSHDLQEFCACVQDMHREIAELSGSTEGARPLAQLA